MEIWEKQLNDRFDMIAIYTEGWDKCYDMVAKHMDSANSSERKILNDYLEHLVPRCRKMQRKFNRIERWKTKDDNGDELECYKIYNYDYLMYKWFRQKCHTIKAYSHDFLVVLPQDLTPEEKEMFEKKVDLDIEF